ncbi:MAG: alpha/beta hydrolase [Candidatus Nanopelagicales bacterium]|nr:alpha/beta hydrolase [Candidatus Nanopelagicales bacterium]MDP4887390.1 alpha/beta hydrolase [Candidatus Nanopelagicales bacterium]
MVQIPPLQLSVRSPCSSPILASPAGRSLISAVVLAAGVVAGVMVTRPSLVAWPRGVRPGLGVGTGVVCAGITWLTLDTINQLRRGRNQFPRLAKMAGVVAVGWLSVTAAKALVGSRADRDGLRPDRAFAATPGSPWVSGSLDSAVDATTLGREGARFVHSYTPAAAINEVWMTDDPPVSPIRIFIGVETAATVADRVAVAIAELERTGAFDRQMLCVIAPAGSGYVNPTPISILEIATRGDCATVAVGYGLRPSFLSLDRVDVAADTQLLLLAGIIDALAARAKPARLVLYGESLGAGVQQAGLNRMAPTGGCLPGAVDRALWVGTPGGAGRDVFRARLDAAGIAHGTVDHPGQISTQHDPRVWFLEHDADPVVRFAPDALWRQPAWLNEKPRGSGVPASMSWRPVVTWVQLLVDTFFATNIRPGDFQARAHDYRADLGEVVRAAFALPMSDAAGQRLERVLRELEQDRAILISHHEFRPGHEAN